MSELKAQGGLGIFWGGDRRQNGDTKHSYVAPTSSSSNLDITLRDKSTWPDCRETGFVRSQLEESSFLRFPSSCTRRPALKREMPLDTKGHMLRCAQ